MSLLKFFYQSYFKFLRYFGIICKATPLAIIALGLSYCFKNNIYNIGAEGQLTMGAIFGGGIGLLFNDSTSVFLLPLMILFGAIGGAFWATIPAILKQI